MTHISLIDQRKLQLDSAVKSLVISVYANCLSTLGEIFGILSISCLTASLLER